MAFHNAVWLLSMVKIQELFPSCMGDDKGDMDHSELGSVKVSRSLALSMHIAGTVGNVRKWCNNSTLRFLTSGSFNSASTWLIEIPALLNSLKKQKWSMEFQLTWTRVDCPFEAERCASSKIHSRFSSGVWTRLEGQGRVLLVEWLTPRCIPCTWSDFFKLVDGNLHWNCTKLIPYWSYRVYGSAILSAGSTQFNSDPGPINPHSVSFVLHKLYQTHPFPSIWAAFTTLGHIPDFGSANFPPLSDLYP